MQWIIKWLKKLGIIKKPEPEYYYKWSDKEVRILEVKNRMKL